MICTAYMNANLWGEQITPLFQIEITIDGENQELNNKIKDVLLLSENQSEAIKELESMFSSIERNPNGDLVLIKDGDEITLKIKKTNLLDDLNVQNVLDKLNLSNLNLAKDTSIVIMMNDDYREIYSNNRSNAVYDKENNRIVISVNSLSDIEDFKKYIKDISATGVAKFDNYLQVLKHELAHHNIETKDEFKNYRDILANAEQFVDSLLPIAISIRNTPYADLKLHLEGTTNYEKFYTELFAWLEADKEFKTLLEKNKDYQKVLNTSIDLDLNEEKSKEDPNTDPLLYNESKLDKANLDLLPEGIGFTKGDTKAYKEYLDIAYGPYITVDNRTTNYTTQIYGFRPGELVYIEWTVKGKKNRPSANFIKSVEKSGNDIKLIVSGRKYDPDYKYDAKVGDTRPWKEKLIIIKSDGTIESEKERGKASEYSARVVAFRKFAGKPVNFDKNGIDRSIDANTHELIKNNAASWFFAYSNAKKIGAYMEKHNTNRDTAEKTLKAKGELVILKNNYPKFLGTRFGLMLDPKDDIGLYFKIGDSSSQAIVEDIVASKGDRLSTKAGNNEALNDASYNLIKTGDIVTYKIWSDTNKQNDYYDVVVLKTFKEGLFVQDIKDGELVGEPKTIRRKDLFAVYSFFNKDASEEFQSEIPTILKEFKEISDELYGNRPTAKESAKKTVFTLKEMLDPKSYHYDAYSFRKFDKDTSDNYTLSQEQAFFHPGKNTVKYIYGEENYPSTEYLQFEKEIAKASYKVYKLLEAKAESGKKTNFYSRDLEDLDRGQNRIDSFGNVIEIGPMIVELLSKGDPVKIKHFLEMWDAKKHRSDKLRLLKKGAYVLLNKKARLNEEQEFRVLEDKRSTLYGVVLAKSKDFLTVAIPNIEWDKEKKAYADFEDFKIIQINVMDFRLDKEYDLTKVFNNMNFERSLINTLGTIKLRIKKTYAEEAKTNKETAEASVKVLLEELAAEVKLRENEVNPEDEQERPHRIGDFYTMVNFYTNFDYIIAEEKEQLRLKAHDIEARNLDRLYYVSMLETGSIVSYKRQPFKKEGEEMRHGSVKNFMVIGKDILSGRPILADIRFKTKGDFTFSYVEPFMADLENIVGVGFLKETITLDHLEVDGSTSTISINPNDRFITDQISLLKKYIESQQMNTYSSKEAAEEKIAAVLQTLEDYHWKTKPDLYVTRTGEIEITKKTRKGEFTFKKRVKIDFNSDKIIEEKYKNYKIIPKTEQFSIIQKWPDGGYKTYSDTDYQVSFSFKNKDNKWVQPKGLRIIDDITRGTVINYTYEKGGKTRFGSGIVLYKDKTYMMLLKYQLDSENPRDFDDIDLDNVTMDNLSMFPLYYGSVNVGDKTNSQYALVLPNVRSLIFTEKPNLTRFKGLKVIADASRHNQAHDSVFNSGVNKMAILQNVNKIHVSFNKYNVSREEKILSIAELEKYLEKFQTLYGIKFKLLSQKEILETYDYKPEFNNGLISNYRAFKVNDDYIVINTDLASLAAPFHEMLHFVIEALYKTNKVLHNELITAAKEHPLLKRIALNYPELSGRLLDEEIFTSVLGIVYSENIKSQEVNHWEQKNKSILDRFFDWLKELLRRFTRKNINIDVSNLEMTWNKQKDILIAFGEDMEAGKFVNEVQENKSSDQKPINTIHKLKQDLISKNMLTMYCI